jgi:hypothetical protein
MNKQHDLSDKKIRLSHAVAVAVLKICTSLTASTFKC